MTNDYEPTVETTSRNSHKRQSRLTRMLALPLILAASGCSSLSPGGTSLLQGLAIGAISSGANQAAQNAVGGQQITVNGGYQGQPQAQTLAIDYIKHKNGTERVGQIVYRKDGELIMRVMDGDTYGCSEKDLEIIRDN